MKKMTIKDIAREAGVSVATVSYVLNNRADQKISEATRKKVLQIVNLFNYTKNSSAVALSARKYGSIAVRGVCNSTLRSAEMLLMLNALSRRAYERGMQVSFAAENGAEKIDYADALICINFDKEKFHRMGEENFIPLIAVECDFDNPLFFQVNINYSAMPQNVPFAVLRPESETLAAAIALALKNAVFITELSQLDNLPDNVHTQSRAIYNALIEKGKSAVLCDEMYEKRIDAILDCVINASARNAETEHIILI